MLSVSIAALRTASLQMASDRRGITAFEYALIGGIITVAIAASVTTLGTAAMRPFATIAAAVGLK
jgi:Flp pilus assembly pilin Flp